MASVVIVTTCILLHRGYTLLMFNILGAFFLKIGVAPFHQWVPSIVEGLSWQSLYGLLVFQKINPILLCTFLVRRYIRFTYLVIIISCLIGSVGGLIHRSLRKILAYSSIRHTSWILSSIFISKLMWIFYFITYSFILLSVFIIFNSNDRFYLNQILMDNKITTIFFRGAALLSLGGLPPFTGFIPKFIVTIEIIRNQRIFILLFLLRGTFIRLFFYTRILLTNLIRVSRGNSFYVEKQGRSQKRNFFNLFFLLAPTLFIIIILNFKLYKLKAFKALKEDLLKFKYEF